MISFAEQLYRNLERSLESADEVTVRSDPERRRECIASVKRAISDLKERVIDHGFEGLEEEISFFKEIKPRFVSLLLYYAYVDIIEMKKPQGSVSDLRSHYEKELSAIRWFHDSHSSLYHYYKGGFSFLDDKLFVRGTFDLPHPFSTLKIDRDERFSTEADYTVSRILANYRLTEYLENSIRLLNNHPAEFLGPVAGKKPLRWTAKVIDLVELVYGLALTGVFNYGKADIKDIADTFEKLFDVKLGNYSLLFSQSIRFRKSGSIRLLREMIDSIQEKLDELDGK